MSGPPPKGLRYGPGGELVPKPNPAPRQASRPQGDGPALLTSATRVQRQYPDGRGPTATDGAPIQGPALKDAPRKSIVGGPQAPGSTSTTATCSVGRGMPLNCNSVSSQPGDMTDEEKDKARKTVRVGVNATLTVTKALSDPILNLDGRTTQRASSTVDSKVGLRGEAGGKRGSLNGGLDRGNRSQYQVELRPRHMREVKSGRRPSPNPLDPFSPDGLSPGESLTLSEERYRGTEGGASGTLRGVKIGLTGRDEKSRRVSSAESRVNPRRVRFTVGNDDLVKRQLSAGAGDEFDLLRFELSTEMTSGRTRARQIDVIDSKTGRRRVRRIVSTGRIPTVRVPGTRDPATVSSVTYARQSALRRLLGPFGVGSAPSANGTQVTETKYKGSRRQSNTMTDRSSGTVYGRDVERDRRGKVTRNRYREALSNVQQSTLNPILASRRMPAVDGNRNVSLDLSAQDLRHIQDMALTRLAAQTRQSDHPMTTAQVRAKMQKDSYDTVPGPEFSRPQDSTVTRQIAGAKDPNDVLAALHATAGHGDGNRVAEYLLYLRNGTAQQLQRTGEHPRADDPRLRIPGGITVVRDESGD